MTASKPSGLTVSPFTDNPDTPVFVETETHRRAVAQARFGIEQGSGLVVITGEPGSGKTAVLDRTALLSAGENAAIVRLSANEIEGENLEAVILRVLRMSEPGIDPDAGIKEALLSCREAGVTPALLIDDADDLDDNGLEVLRHIAELEKDGDPLFRIVIAGRPALRALFFRDDLAGLRRAMAASYQLGALGRDEVEEYVVARIRMAGLAGDFIPTVGFLNALTDQSGGNPGRINRLAGRAITHAELAGRSELLLADLEDGEQEASLDTTAEIEDAEVLEAQSADEVAARRADEDMPGGDAAERKGSVSVTDLNAAIEQLGQGCVSSVPLTEEMPSVPEAAPVAVDPEPAPPATPEPEETPRLRREVPEDIDVWEPAVPMDEAEQERLDSADLGAALPDGHPLIAEMQAYVNDLREQIDSLRHTIDTLREQAEGLDARRRAAREKIGGRLDSIRARLDDIRHGD